MPGISAGEVTVDVKPAMGDFAKRVSTGVAGATKRLSAGLTKAGKALTLGATLPIVGFSIAAVKAFDESRKVAAQTEAVIKSTGGAAGVTAKQVSGLAEAISKKTGIDDEAIQSGQNMLLTFTNVRNEVGKDKDIFNQATQTLVDMSTAMGTDAKSGAIQLGKALNDPIKGISALTRVGVTFTDGQKKMIARLVETGDVAGAQQVILAELKKEFGGSAEAQATASDKMKVTLGNLAESFGSILAPAVDKAFGHISKLLGGFQDLPESTKKAATAVLGFVAVVGPALFVLGKLQGFALGLGSKLKSLAKGLIMLGSAITGASAPFLALALAVAGVITIFVDAAIQEAKFRAHVDGLTDALRDGGITVDSYRKGIKKLREEYEGTNLEGEIAERGAKALALAEKQATTGLTNQLGRLKERNSAILDGTAAISKGRLATIEAMIASGNFAGAQKLIREESKGVQETLRIQGTHLDAVSSGADSAARNLFALKRAQEALAEAARIANTHLSNQDSLLQSLAVTGANLPGGGGNKPGGKNKNKPGGGGSGQDLPDKTPDTAAIAPRGTTEKRGSGASGPTEITGTLSLTPDGKAVIRGMARSVSDADRRYAGRR